MSTARKFLKAHRFKTSVDKTKNYLRFRQLSPDKFETKSFRTIILKDDIKAVIGCPLRKNPAPSRCPACGLEYRDFSTGLSFADVRRLLWSGDERPETWRYKRRHTVLGKWHQIKDTLFEEHCATCDGQTDSIHVEIEGFVFESQGEVFEY